MGTPARLRVTDSCQSQLWVLGPRLHPSRFPSKREASLTEETRQGESRQSRAIFTTQGRAGVRNSASPSPERHLALLPLGPTAVLRVPRSAQAEMTKEVKRNRKLPSSSRAPEIGRHRAEVNTILIWSIKTKLKEKV